MKSKYYNSLIKEIKQMEIILNNLSIQHEAIDPKNHQLLQEFNSAIEDKLENPTLSKEEFQELLEKCIEIQDQIETINEPLVKLINKKITFNQFKKLLPNKAINHKIQQNSVKKVPQVVQAIIHKKDKEPQLVKSGNKGVVSEKMQETMKKQNKIIDLEMYKSPNVLESKNSIEAEKQKSQKKISHIQNKLKLSQKKSEQSNIQKLSQREIAEKLHHEKKMMQERPVEKSKIHEKIKEEIKQKDHHMDMLNLSPIYQKYNHHEQPQKPQKPPSQLKNNQQNNSVQQSLNPNSSKISNNLNQFISPVKKYVEQSSAQDQPSNNNHSQPSIIPQTHQDSPVLPTLVPTNKNTFTHFKNKRDQFIPPIMLHESNGQIQEPFYVPSNVSFIEQQTLLQEYINKSKNLTFKQFIYEDQLRNVQIKESDQHLLPISRSIIKVSAQKQLKKEKVNSIMKISQMLKSKNTKMIQQIQLYNQLQESKVKELRHKIKNLQKSNSQMKLIMDDQKSEIFSLKSQSSVHSQFQYQMTHKINNFIGQQDNLLLHQSKKSEKRGLSNSKLHSQLSKTLETYGQVIEYSKYESYFANITNYYTRKAVLLNKSLLFKDQKIEIGCTTNKIETDKTVQLITTLYLNSDTNVVDLSISIKSKDQEKDCLHYSTSKKKIQRLDKDYQEKMSIVIEIKEVPYSIPEIIVQFGQEQQRHSKHIIMLPCSLNKILVFVETNQEEINKVFLNTKNIICTKEFAYNKFLKNVKSLEEYFPRGIFLKNVVKKSENNVEYVCKCKLFNNPLFIKLMIKSNYMAILIQRSQVSVESEYLLILLEHLFMKYKSLE